MVMTLFKSIFLVDLCKVCSRSPNIFVFIHCPDTFFIPVVKLPKDFVLCFLNWLHILANIIVNLNDVDWAVVSLVIRKSCFYLYLASVVRKKSHINEIIFIKILLEVGLVKSKNPFFDSLICIVIS